MNKNALGKFTWIILILCIVAIASTSVVYFLIMSSGEDEFPKNIESFGLVSKDSRQDECRLLGAHSDTASITRQLGISEQEVCTTTTLLGYQNNLSHKITFVQLSKVTKGKDAMKKFLTNISALADNEYNLRGETFPYVGPKIYRLEKHELFWFAQEYDIIMNQQYTLVVNKNMNSTSYEMAIATGDNPVFRYFLNKYPPK